MFTCSQARQPPWLYFIDKCPCLDLHVFGKVLVCGYHLKCGGGGGGGDGKDRAGGESKINSKASWKILFGLSSGYGFIKSDIWIRSLKYICCPDSVLNFY